MSERIIDAQKIMYDGVMNDDSLFKGQVDRKLMAYTNMCFSYID